MVESEPVLWSVPLSGFEEQIDETDDSNPMPLLSYGSERCERASYGICAVVALSRHCDLGALHLTAHRKLL